MHIDMMKSYLSFVLMIAFASVFMSGCFWDDCGGGPPNGGFTVMARDEIWPNCSPPGSPGCPPGTPNPVPTIIGHPGAQVSGSWQCDFGYNCPAAQAFGGYISSYGSVYHFGIPGTDSPVYTDRQGNAVINYGRVNAVWNGNVVAWSNGSFNSPPCAQSSVGPAQFFVSLANAKMEWDCIISPGSVTGPGPAFIISGSQPSTLTISRAGLGLTTSSGMPGLFVYNENAVNTQGLTSSTGYSNGCDVGVLPPPAPPQPSIIATSVSPDGTSATFPFPTLGDGSPLPAGYYGFNIWNQSNPGKFDDMGIGFFSVGSSTTVTTPYGVDVVSVTRSGQDCYLRELNTYCSPSWGPTTSSQPVYTLSSLGQVRATNGTIAVGSQPTTIKAYGNSDVYTSTDPYGSWTEVVQPAYAIVTNLGSNNVSILDLVNNAVASTIAVGSQPVAVTLNSIQTKAYVANYGSSTVSEINLGTNTQSRVAGVGAYPEALAMDPNGTALWVGGLNYISKLDLSSFSTIQSISVSGQVTSLAVSAGQNSLVYTTVATASGSTTFQAQVAAIGSGAVQGTYAQRTISSSSYYAESITTGGPVSGAPGWLSSALVSANYGNSVVVVGTPSGFAVLDLIRQIDLLDGTTPSPVRGIATDPAQGIAYLTAPDSNSVISVPLPVQHTAAQGRVTISGTEQTVTFNPCAPSYCQQTAPDAGTVSIMVDTAPIGVTYGSGDTPASIAARLVSAINGVNYPVLASANGGVLSLGATTKGTGPNSWALQATCKSNFAQYGVGCSFSTTTSGSTLSGGN